MVSSAVFALAVVACDRPVGPDGTELQKTSGSGTDTSGTGGPINPPTRLPVDTGSTYSGLVRLTIFVQSAVRNGQNSGDTLNVTPLAGARVDVEGILELAQSAQSGTTDASGRFVVTQLPVGPYRVRVTPPASSGIAAVTGQTILNQAEVVMPFTLFR